jgi:hypothetical protein
MNYNISPAHFVAIAERLNPTNDFNIDAKAIMDMGDLLNKVITYQKWASCPNLEQELSSIISRYFSEVAIETTEISSILYKARENFDSPSITELYVSDCIKKRYNTQIGFTYDINDIVKGRLFMAFTDKIYLYISDLYKGYKKTWDDIEDSYDMVNDHVSEIFKYLDDNEDVKIMEQIDEETNEDYIKRLANNSWQMRMHFRWKLNEPPEDDYRVARDGREGPDWQGPWVGQRVWVSGDPSQRQKRS